MPRVIRWEPSPGAFLVLLLYFGLAAAMPTRRRGVLCPFRLATGRNCPLCGLTRSTHELARGRVRAAAGYNALTPVLWLAGIVWAGGFRFELTEPVQSETPPHPTRTSRS